MKRLTVVLMTVASLVLGASMTAMAAEDLKPAAIETYADIVFAS